LKAEYGIKILFQGFFYHLYLLLNICLCHDLYKSMYSPFEAKKKRIILYYVISVFGAIIIALIAFFTYTFFCYLSMLLMIIYLVISIGCTIYCLQRLPKSGLSKEMKSLILKRHLYWTIIFILSNLYPFYA